MAVTTTRLVAVVVGVGIVGVAAGAGAGLLTQEDPRTGTGPVLPMAAAPTPVTTPSTTPIARKTPVPDDEPALDTTDLGYRTVDFRLTKAPHDPVRIRLRVPQGWKYQRIEDETDQIRYVDPTGKRWIRIESGFLVERPPVESMNELVTTLRTGVAPENDLRIEGRDVKALTGEDGDSRNVATVRYSYIPNQRRLQVIVRWVGYGVPGNVAVELSVTGLPQDEQALAEIMERASETVQRSD